MASIRVLGRLLMSRGQDPHSTQRSYNSHLRSIELDTRGWRAFVATPAVDAPVTVTLGNRVVESRTDRGGLIDVTIRGHGLGPGWHDVLVESPQAQPVRARVLVVGTTQPVGIISDIDDTVLSTSLPRPLIAAWNTFVKVEGTRRAVPGMATMYREILANHPGAPIIYLSTGAWNTQPWLTRFLRRHGYPPGPMLARELPHVRWLLIGDDGQHDPKIYTEFARQRPDRVRGIAIRELSAGEQVLSHVIPVANDDLAPAPTEDLPVPVIRGHDGFELARQVRPLLRDDG